MTVLAEGTRVLGQFGLTLKRKGMALRAESLSGPGKLLSIGGGKPTA